MLIQASQKRLFWLFVFATLASPTIAHAPYERLWTTVTDPSGRQLRIVARYTDGIFAADPVVVVVLDSNGIKVAEAPSARDALVRCPRYDSCHVFLYEPPGRLFPTHILRLGVTGFTPETAKHHRTVGLVLPLRHRFVELFWESLFLAIMPVLALFLARRERTALIVVAWVVFVPVAIAWMSFMLFGIALNTRISFVWLLLGVLVLVVPSVFIAAFSRRSTPAAA